MAKYREYKGLNLPNIDQEILNKWVSENTFSKSIEERSKDNSFVFYEGPPSANGKPGIHHVMARTVKDLFCRYQTMKGKRVERKGGWDTHGLPVELKVESELGITKDDIGVKISVEDYNKACREAVMKFKELWDDLTRKMGYWADLDNPYITFENEYIESVWSLLKDLHDKGLIYKGYTIQPYSPAAGTGLSSHELNMPGAYKDVSDTSAVAQFELIENEASAFLFDGNRKGGLYVIAWTTTPWTLPSNLGLAVGKGINYVKVATYNPYTKLPINILLAKELLGKWFKPAQAEADYDAFDGSQKVIPYIVLGEYSGAQLDGLRYHQLMPYVQPSDGDAFKVILGDFVSTSDGTGIVHIAPSFGADDMRVGKQNGLGALTLVDKQGKFVAEVTDFAGRYVKNYRDESEDTYRDVNIDISIMLKEQNKAFNVQKYQHNYPHCWRTDKPILYYPLDSWFVKASEKRERMVELNKTINWKPAHTGEKRFGNWLENLQDWNLSRSRFWGIPLPIWRTADETTELCIGTVAELKAEIEKANKALGLDQRVPEDLHKPYIDDVTLVSDTGEEMLRESDLIDVWFDSGSMPYAQWHYPMENQEKFIQNFPADFISEGVDQTRGWFYSLHAIAAMTQDSIAFKNVVSTGLVLDKNGVKMSKRLGNVVDPFDTLATHGADATRWYMMTNAQPWDNLKFDIAGIEEVKRKFFGTLYNTYSFFALYANLDNFAYEQEPITLSERPEIDRWVTSELNTLISEVDEQYSQYEPTMAGRKIQSFVEDHLSNWYVRLCRRRFWKGEYAHDKIAAYQTLYECLLTISKLMAPIAPFFGDWLYRNLNDSTGQEPHDSVHLTLLPAADKNRIDRALEERMDYAQRISSLILSLRKKERIRVRQPLQKILLPILDEGFQDQVEAVKSLILAEVNIKEIEYLTDTSGVIKKRIKPNFKTLGRKLGKEMKAGAAIINNLDQDQIALIEKTGVFQLVIEDSTHELVLEDFDISADEIPGWQVATDGEITLALDITISEELAREGIARELVNRIQNLRKDNNYEVTDRINVTLLSNEVIEESLKDYKDYIAAEVLADEINAVSNLEGEIVTLVEGIDTVIVTERV
ncbi:MAG: isoleucyl-tRNA synthetase [Saprospiraceae bacterium]|jgi:isoleucyl-tRNA synthetase